MENLKGAQSFADESTRLDSPGERSGSEDEQSSAASERDDTAPEALQRTLKLDESTRIDSPGEGEERPSDRPAGGKDDTAATLQRTGSSASRRPPRPPSSSTKELEGSRKVQLPGSTQRHGNSQRFSRSSSPSRSLSGSRKLGGSRPVSGTSQDSPATAPAMKRRPRPNALISQSLDTRPNFDTESSDDNASPKARRVPPKTHTGAFRPALNLSGSLGSLRSSSFNNSRIFGNGGTPGPDRDDFKRVTGGVSVIFFDFDGTLTATPGDQAVRATKMKELQERAPMLETNLTALRDAGIAMRIISKSTQGTVQDALSAAGLEHFFTLPVVGKAVGFEGKAGFIEEMLRRGQLPLSGKAAYEYFRILLVDDDLLELERAKARGYQTFAPASMGGLSEEDFAVILRGVRAPEPRASPESSLAKFSRRGRRTFCAPPAKWRTLILFSGECFEG